MMYVKYNIVVISFLYSEYHFVDYTADWIGLDWIGLLLMMIDGNSPPSTPEYVQRMNSSASVPIS
jgi:hypothetical protein